MRDLISQAAPRSASDARQFARVSHDGQTDKLGEPYFDHVYRVAQASARQAARWGIDGALPKQIAYLHDVIEDAPYDADHLRREGFSEEVVSGVLWLTKTGNEPYAAWIERLCQEAPLPVLIVKLADVQDNSDPERLGRLPVETRERLERKYGPAGERLERAIRERGDAALATPSDSF